MTIWAPGRRVWGKPEITQWCRGLLDLGESAVYCQHKVTEECKDCYEGLFQRISPKQIRMCVCRSHFRGGPMRASERETALDLLCLVAAALSVPKDCFTPLSFTNKWTLSFEGVWDWIRLDVEPSLDKVAWLDEDVHSLLCVCWCLGAVMSWHHCWPDLN